MNRTIYDSAFHILETQKEIFDKLDSLGVSFEYGQGFIGKTLESLINDSDTIIIECLGLEDIPPVNKQCTINGLSCEVSVDIFCAKGNDEEWSITHDDFYDFFYAAIDNIQLRDLMWRAMVEKDVRAKEQFNKSGHGLIGQFEKNYGKK